MPLRPDNRFIRSGQVRGFVAAEKFCAPLEPLGVIIVVDLCVRVSLSPTTGSAMKKTAVVLLLLSVGIGGAMLFRKTASEHVLAHHLRPLPPLPVESMDRRNERAMAKPTQSPVQGVPALPPKPMHEKPQRQPQRPAVLQPGARPPLPQLSEFGGDATVAERTQAVRSNKPVATSPKRSAPIPESSARRRRDKVLTQTHTIVNGDTLERIARRYLGDASLAEAIYQINRDRIADPNRLPLGKKILIPAREQLPTRLSPANPPDKDLVPLQWTLKKAS